MATNQHTVLLGNEIYHRIVETEITGIHVEGSDIYGAVYDGGMRVKVVKSDVIWKDLPGEYEIVDRSLVIPGVTRVTNSYHNCQECHGYTCQSCQLCHQESICPIGKPPCAYTRSLGVHWQHEPEIQFLVLCRQQQGTAYSCFYYYCADKATWFKEQKDYQLSERVVAVLVNEWVAEGMWKENPDLSAYAPDYQPDMKRDIISR